MSRTKVFELFIDKLVNVILKNVKGSQIIDGEMVEGNIVDEDEEHYFLSTNDEITEAIPKDEVARIFIDDTVDIPIEIEEIGDVH